MGEVITAVALAVGLLLGLMSGTLVMAAAGGINPVVLSNDTFVPDAARLVLPLPVAAWGCVLTVVVDGGGRRASSLARNPSMLAVSVAAMDAEMVLARSCNPWVGLSWGLDPPTAGSAAEDTGGSPLLISPLEILDAFSPLTASKLASAFPRLSMPLPLGLLFLCHGPASN